MTPENIKKLELSVQNLKDKKARIYFIVQDTKGNAKASIRYIYQMAMALKNEGYNPIMLHEKPDYTSVDGWLKGDLMSQLPHKSIEGQNLEVSPEDLIIVPEILKSPLIISPKIAFSPFIIATSLLFADLVIDSAITSNIVGFPVFESIMSVMAIGDALI